MRGPDLFMSIRFSQFLKLLLVTCALLLCSHKACMAFPVDADWVPVYMNAAIKQDPNGDSNGARNVVSDGTHATTYYANDGTYIYFRLRLDDDPTGSGGQGGLVQFGWGVEIDTDQDDTDYEWIIMVNGKDAPETVSLAQNTVQTTAGDPSDVPEITFISNTIAGNIQITAADSSYNGDQDYFLSWRMPLAGFLASTGITPATPIRLFEGSSSSSNTLTESGADFVGGPDLTTGFSDFMNLSGTPLATGVVKYVADLAGTGDVTQAAPGDTLFIRVDDADLNTATSSIQTITVAVTSPFGETETVTLTETGNNTGIFTGSLATVLGVAAGADNNGSLVVANMQVITVTYNDATSATGAAAVLTDTLTIVAPPVAADAIITTTASILAGNTVTISVTDTDVNTNIFAAETITVSVQNLTTGETETVTCTETGVNTGIFTATLATVFNAATGANNNGAMNAIGGHIIRSTYNEPQDAGGNPAVRTADTNVTDDTNFVTITNPNGTFNTTTHDVTGATDPNSTVTMTDPISGLTLTTTADALGNYTFANVIFPQGATTYTVVSTDPFGNVASAVATVNIDSTNFITVTSPVANSTINVTTADFVGETDPNATVTVIEPASGLTLTVTADASGNFTFPNIRLNIGLNTLNFTSTDSEGNVATTSTNVTVDTNIALNITSITNGATYNTPGLELAGETDPGATVTTTHPQTGAVLTTTADGTGHYTFGVLTFPEGTQTRTVNAVDEAGNTATTNVTFTIDTLNTNTITTAGTFLVSNIGITGTTNPLSTVTFTHPSTGFTYTAIADALGNYVFSNVFFPDGTHNIITTSTDPAGNIAVDTSTVTINTNVVVINTTNTITSNLPPDNSVVSTSPLPISGTTTAGSTVTLTDPVTGTVYTVTADGAGNFTFPAVNLAVGPNPITISSVSPAGVISSQESTITYNLGISLNVTSPLNLLVTQSTTNTISGQTVPGATVTLTDPVTGNPVVTIADGAGNYSFANVTFPTGEVAVTVSADDGLGNTASITNTYFVTTQPLDADINTSERTIFGSPIFIEVRDPETYLDATRIDTLQVLVSNPATGDSEVRTLVETGINTGIFRGSLNTVESAVSDGSNSGALSVLYGDTVVTTYVDPIASNGNLNSQVLDTTLITNDELKIIVNVFTAETAGTQEQPLEQSAIAIVEYDAAGNLTGNVYNYKTGGGGLIPAEFISRMARDNSYRIFINDLIDGLPYSQSELFTLADLEAAPIDNRGVRTFEIALDPAGFVYDFITGVRIDGADVTLFHDDGTTVAGPFAVFTQNPGRTQTNSQLSGDTGTTGGFEFIGSGAGSDLTAGFYYITVSYITNPALDAIYYPVALTAGPWAGIQEPYRGQVFLVDLQNQPIGMRVPLFRRGTTAPLIITKAANRDTAAVGDIVTFTVSVRNLSNNQTDPNTPIIVKDALPLGFVFIDNSAVFGDSGAVATTQVRGGDLYFTVGSLLAAGSANNNDLVTIYYQAVVDTSVQPGAYLRNTAVATISGVVLSNEAAAEVRVVDDPLLDRATLIGRVFVDLNRNGNFDKHEPGVPGVGLVMDDGLYVTTDGSGKYSVAGAKTGLVNSGLRVIKIDMNTLPNHAKLTTRESQFVILTQGGIDKANFGVSPDPYVLKLIHESEIKDANCDEKAPDRRRLFVAMFDAWAGEMDSGGSAVARPDLNFIPEDGAAKGRVAYFYELEKSRFYIKTAYDSDRRHTYIMENDRDRDDYYPTYGDSSTTRYLTETRGKFFLDLRGPTSRVYIGNYALNFNDIELASIYRSNSGIMYELNKKTILGSEKLESSFTLATSRRGQKRGRTDWRATGGTHYHLAHADIAPGSEQIQIKVYDRIAPERVIESFTLRRDIDYDIDYDTGRVRLFMPAAMFAHGSYIVDNGLNNGDPVWIAAEYAYNPHDEDYGTVAGRFSIGWPLWEDSSPIIKIGSTYLNENKDGVDHKLQGYDITFNNEIKWEFAESRAGGEPWMGSLDGGITLFTMGGAATSDGKARKFNGAFRGLTSIIFPFLGNLESSYYFYDIDSNFTGSAYRERGVRRAGANISGEWKTWNLGIDYTRASAKPGAGAVATFDTTGGHSRNLRLFVSSKKESGTTTFEYLREYSAGITTNTGITRGARDTFAARIERKLTARITVTAAQQASTGAYHNYQTRLGIIYQMRENMAFTIEGVASTRGGGGRLGFERTGGGGARTYMDISTNCDRAGSDTLSATAGMSRPLGDNASAYMEYQTLGTGGDNVSRRVVGVNQKYDAGRGVLMTVSLERTEERSSLQGAYRGNVARFTTEFESPGMNKYLGEIEYRRNTGGIQKEFISSRLAYDGTIMRDLHAYAEHEYDVSDDTALQRADAKYTKTLFGLAYRPGDSDRVNILARAGRIHERRSPAANTLLNPDSVSIVLSLEGIYDISHDLKMSEKIASKNVSELLDPLPRARTHTVLHITSFKWNMTSKWDLRLDFRTRRQPTQLNHRDGLAAEIGFTIKDTVRIGTGYNFSEYSDDEFARNDHSYRGLVFRVSGKF